MASKQQQPRRWLSLGASSRPRLPTPSYPPATIPSDQQPIARPQVLPFRSPSPQPTLPQETPLITLPRPAGVANAASVPRSPVALTPHSAPPPSSPVPPAQAPLFPARPSPHTAPAPRSLAASPGSLSPGALPPPITPTTRTLKAPKPLTITKSNPTSPITKTPTSMQTSPKVSEPPASPPFPVTKPPLSFHSPPPSAPSPTAFVSSPETITTFSKTPPQSPQIKPISHPPSPLTLPTAQTKTARYQKPKKHTELEQITVLMHGIRPGKSTMLQNSPPDYEQTHLGTTNKNINFYKKGKAVCNQLEPSIITLTGENKGATMEMQSKPVTTFINSNVQGINNSILYNSSFTHNDPGVHLKFSMKSNVGHGFHLKNHIKD